MPKNKDKTHELRVGGVVKFLITEVGDIKLDKDTITLIENALDEKAQLESQIAEENRAEELKEKSHKERDCDEEGEKYSNYDFPHPERQERH